VTRTDGDGEEWFIWREAGAAGNESGRGFNSHLRYHFTGCARPTVDNTNTRSERRVPLSFIENNWWLILVMVVSGGMLLWPLIQHRFSPMREIGALQATQLINRKNALMLDVRDAKEYEDGRVPNAVHLPVSQLAGRGTELKNFMSRPVVAYCDRGNRSRAAAATLTKLGFAEVYTLRGGLRAWTEAGLPLEKGQ